MHEPLWGQMRRILVQAGEGDAMLAVRAADYTVTPAEPPGSISRCIACSAAPSEITPANTRPSAPRRGNDSSATAQ